jgi:predicted nucleic acid-binding protein
LKFLVDTSALVRILRRQVDPAWFDLVDRGLLTVCEPVMAETLLIADAKGYDDLEQTIAQTYVLATVPDAIWDLVGAIRRELAPHSAHKGLSVADLVIAATAIRLKLEVLHEDADFETVARFVPQLRQRRISSAL